jgi:hypothetical protein
MVTKWLLRIGIPLLVLAGCIFGDVKLAQLLFAHLPSIGEWVFWAKVGIGFGIFWFTAGIIALVTIGSGLLIAVITED